MELEEVKKIQAELRRELSAFAEAKGMKLAKGPSAKYGPNSITITFEIARVGEEGVLETKAADQFRFNAEYLGMKAEDLGEEVTISGRRFRITGLNPRAAKHPVLLDPLDGGRGMRCDAALVAVALERERGVKPTVGAPYRRAR